MKFHRVLAVALLAFMASSVTADELEGVKCVVNPKADAKENASADYMDAMVYFCCNNCAGKFKEDPDKFAETANFQLVATEQFKQKACPLTGRPVNAEQTSEIGDVEVGFCCGNCKGRVDKAEDDAARIKMVFAKAAFKKGFEAADNEIDLEDVKCPLMGEDVSAEYSAKYKDGTVYFCCESCIEDFDENSEEHAAKANMQLVHTKQFKQTKCPFSGGAVKDGTEVKIGELEVGFCCPNCQGKVAGAEDDEERIAMVFSKNAFKKGFEKTKK